MSEDNKIIRLRNDTEANFTVYNTLLLAGETAHVTSGQNKCRYKIGPGLFNELNYTDKEVRDSVAAETAARQSADAGLQAQVSGKEDKASKGNANGYASLDGNTKVPLSQLPDAILGQMVYGGTINAGSSTAVTAALSANAKSLLNVSSNTVTLNSTGAGNGTSAFGAAQLQGCYFIASADSQFASLGILTGDWLISAADGWKKIDNTDAVTGVKGSSESTYRMGNVSITKANIGLGNVTNDAQVKAAEKGAVNGVATLDGAGKVPPRSCRNPVLAMLPLCLIKKPRLQARPSPALPKCPAKHPPPAWRLLIVDDSRTSDICRGLIQEGKQSLALPSDHPFWDKFGFPPYHYQCRTGLQAVYSREIKNGAVIDNPEMDELQTNFKPLDGFGGNPLDKESWWMMTEGMALRAARYNIFNEVESFAGENGLYNFALSLVRGTDVERLEGTNYAAKKAAMANPSQKEVLAAKVLEENGHTVFFTPENKSKKGLKNYDAIIDGRLGEFKKLKSFDKIRKRLNEADGQRAAVVCLEPPMENHTLDEAASVVTNWFKSSQHIIKYVDTVLLLWGGQIKIIKN